MLSDSRATLATRLAHGRQKTAISRTDYSRPIKVALADGLINLQTTVLDFGCGRGDDVRHLRLHGIRASGWDPAHMADGELAPAQVVNLGYVVNVIEDPEERARCLQSAWTYADCLLIVSARLKSESPELDSIAPYGDGFVTSISTFHKFYQQAELKDWIEALLSNPATAASPGVFYVFRSSADRLAYLASRHRRHNFGLAQTVGSSIEAYKELLHPLVTFFEKRGRAPVEDELPEAKAIREQFGSLRKAFRLVQRAYDAEEWRSVVTARGEDLLIFLALSRFEGRPRFGQIPLSMRRDIRTIFSSYRQACEEADIVLLAVGDLNRVSRAARRSKVGKITPSAIYIHESALGSLPPLLRLYEGCARSYIGRVEGANIVKLHIDEPMVSYLSYPNFESDPHPTLAESLTVHLQTFRVRERNYVSNGNPPILHKKEAFVSLDHPHRAKFERLTRQEESKGLYEETTRIGTRRNWQELLAAKGLTLRGHRLIRMYPT